MTMEHDGTWDWDADGGHDGGPGDGGLGDGGLGDAETVDVPDPWDPDPADSGDVRGHVPGEPVTAGVGIPLDASAEAHVDAHVDAYVDEPLALADDPDPDFPPALDLGDLPEPVDGPPWTDAALLGDGPLDDPSVDGSPDVADLYSYAGLTPPAGDDPWTALLTAEDPATAALARWWAPN